MKDIMFLKIYLLGALFGGMMVFGFINLIK